jgi:origin recognition complex subunit 3
VQTTLEEADQATQEKIVSFVSQAAQREQDTITAIPTGLVVAGPSIASHGRYFERLGRKIRETTNSLYLVLNSNEGPNLKTLLKNIIQKATAIVNEDDDEAGRPANSRNGPRLLNFDLGHLYEWQKLNRAESVIVTFQDSEAFDTGVLVEAIDLFQSVNNTYDCSALTPDSSWLDRLPFVLLFGIATSAESFEDRLVGNSLRYLEGQKFDVTQSDEIIEKLFSATIANPDLTLRVGPSLSRRILDRQRDHVQNVQDFSDGLKYAFMSHFYANYASIFLKDDLEAEDIPEDVFEAVRNLPSFRRSVRPRSNKSS